MQYLLVVLVACGGGGGARQDGGGGSSDGGGSDASASYAIGGTVVGLGGSGLVLRNNGGNDLAITQDGTFVFSQPVADGASYAVTIASQPANESCVVDHGTGNVAGADVTGIVVWCGGETRTLTAGFGYTCGIRSDGSLWCWGTDVHGQLGDGTLSSTGTPVQLALGTTWNAIAASIRATCAIREDNTLWCWGSETATPTTPQQVGSASTWRSISVAMTHRCGIQTDGSLWCWGSNSSFDIGDGTNIDRPNPVHIGSDSWRDVAAAGGHTCAIRADGTLWCWGTANDGELGTGTAMDFESSPVQVGTDTNWTSITAGDVYTCALRTDGTLWCWGINHQGVLGTGTGIDAYVPTQVGAQTWRTIAAQSIFTCGIQSDATLWCWGAGTAGEIGDGTLDDQPTPVQIGAAHPWARLAVGSQHGCATDASGTTWCWGDNAQGQLGLGYLGGSYAVPTQSVF
jgi:alpha-tubulin suppressor-like RCC1 family protein